MFYYKDYHQLARYRVRCYFKIIFGELHILLFISDGSTGEERVLRIMRNKRAVHRSI
jgi:hypothetical protein